MSACCALCSKWFPTLGCQLLTTGWAVGCSVGRRGFPVRPTSTTDNCRVGSLPRLATDRSSDNERIERLYTIQSNPSTSIHPLCRTACLCPTCRYLAEMLRGPGLLGFRFVVVVVDVVVDDAHRHPRLTRYRYLTRARPPFTMMPRGTSNAPPPHCLQQ